MPNLNSFASPEWAAMASDAAQRVGINPALLNGIRMGGERSNWNQVSSAGARGVYQFIPSTRNLILNKYGVDAYASPYSNTLAAALLVRDLSKQYGGDPRKIFAAYNAGGNPRTWATPGVQSYVQRAMQAGGLSGPVSPAPYLQQADAAPGVDDDGDSDVQQADMSNEAAQAYGMSEPQVSQNAQPAQQNNAWMSAYLPDVSTNPAAGLPDLGNSAWLKNYVQGLTQNA